MQPREGTREDTRMEHPSQGWDQALHLAPLSRMRDGSPRLLSIYRGHLHFQKSNFPTHSQQRREVLGSSAIGDLQSAVLTQCVHISQRPGAHLIPRGGNLKHMGPFRRPDSLTLWADAHWIILMEALSSGRLEDCPRPHSEQRKLRFEPTFSRF